MRAAWNTDVGLVRENNEDFILADPQRELFLLADGMGGARGGEVASELAVRAAYDLLKEAIPSTAAGDLPRLLAEGMAAAHSAVSRRGQAEPQLTGMGTTLDMVAVRDSRAFICHVGDSRVYLVRAAGLRRITTDDNLGAVLAESGRYSEENIPEGARHILTQAVGVSDQLLPQIHTIDLLTEDLLLLCSDGLTGLVEDRRIQEVVRHERENLDRLSFALVEEAKARGGLDNVSVIVVEPGKGPAAPLHPA